MKEGRPGHRFVESKDIIIPEAGKVFGGLQDVRSGAKVAPELLSRAMSGEIKRVLFLGEPGNGKTVNLLQFIASFNHNAEMLGIKKPLIVSQYDSFLNGQDDDTTEFNLRMYRSVRVRERANPSALSVVEVPAVGMTTVKNRGVEFMRLVAHDSHSREDSTAFVFLVTNRAVQTRAAYLRADIRDMKQSGRNSRVHNEEIIKYLSAHGLDLTNVPDSLGTYLDLQEQFSKMAREEHMREIRKEEEVAISDWSLESADIYKENLEKVSNLPIKSSDILEVMREFGISQDTKTARLQAEHTAQRFVDSSRDQAAYVMHRFGQMHVPENNGLIVFSPYTNSRVTLDYSIYKAA